LGLALVDTRRVRQVATVLESAGSFGEPSTERLPQLADDDELGEYGTYLQCSF
jgi:hypothetical protein